MDVLWLLLSLLLLSPSPCRGAAGTPAPALRTTSNGRPGASENTAKLHPRYIRGATKAHPTALPVEDHDGPLMTVSDNDDRAGGPEEGRDGCKSMQGPGPA